MTCTVMSDTLESAAQEPLKLVPSTGLNQCVDAGVRRSGKDGAAAGLGAYCASAAGAAAGAVCRRRPPAHAWEPSAIHSQPFLPHRGESALLRMRGQPAHGAGRPDPRYIPVHKVRSQEGWMHHCYVIFWFSR